MTLLAPTPFPITRDDAGLDLARVATVSMVMATHSVGWHDAEDTVALYRWLDQATPPGLPEGLKIYPSSGEAASFLHAYRAEVGRDTVCEWCTDPGEPPVFDTARLGVDECALATVRYVTASHPSRGCESQEILAVYEWVVATSMPLLGPDPRPDQRRYDDGDGAAAYLHAWRTRRGLETEDSCVLCRDHGAGFSDDASEEAVA